MQLREFALSSYPRFDIAVFEVKRRELEYPLDGHFYR